MELTASRFNKRLYFFAVLVLPLAMASCGGSKMAKKDYYFDIDEKDPASKKYAVYWVGKDKGASLAPKDQVIHMGDEIIIRFLNNFSLAEQMTITGSTSEVGFLVDVEGKVSLPILGRVKLDGLSRKEAAKKLEGLYSAYLVNPILDVLVKGRAVTVWGEVRQPGIINLTEDRSTLIDVISKCGGLTTYSKTHNIRLIRTLADGSLEMQVFDFSKFQTLSQPEIYVQDGDMVVVEPRKVKIVLDKIQPYTTVISIITTFATFGVIIWQNFRRNP